jgi:hypothetical protein
MIFILTILCFATEPEPIMKDELFEAANRNIEAYFETYLETCLRIAYNPEDC